jgi:hypothetical protein
MFTILRGTIIGKIVYKFVEIPLYLCVPEDDKHSPKYLGDFVYIDNLQFYTFYVQLLVYTG